MDGGRCSSYWAMESIKGWLNWARSLKGVFTGQASKAKGKSSSSMDVIVLTRVKGK